MTVLEQNALEMQMAKDKAILELAKSLKYQVDNYDLGVKLIADALEKISTSLNEISSSIDELNTKV